MQIDTWDSAGSFAREWLAHYRNRPGEGWRVRFLDAAESMRRTAWILDCYQQHQTKRATMQAIGRLRAIARSVDAQEAFRRASLMRPPRA